MKVGIELGWRAIRVVTVGTQNEILSVNDVGQPSVVTTPPIVALSEGGALVGQTAIDLIQDQTQAALATIGHALAGLGVDLYSAALLAILLEKIGRDIEGFGSNRSHVRFIVSEDIIAKDPSGDAARDHLALAAHLAGFSNPSLSYRVDAAVREGLDAYSTDQIKTLTTGTQPVVRTIVIDAGPLSLSVHAIVADEPSVAHWAGRPPESNMDPLTFDMFRHFALTVEAQTGANFSAPVMNSIWELVRDAQSPAFQPVFDQAGQSRLLDVKGCRGKLAEAVRQSLPGLLANLKDFSNDSFIFIGGQYATIPEVNETIRDICIQTLAKPRAPKDPIPLYISDVPAHGVAGAVRFGNLTFDPLELPSKATLPTLSDLQQILPAKLLRAAESLVDLRAMPINDGQWPPVTQKRQGKQNGPSPAPTALLSGVISPTTFNIARGVDSAGQEVGAFWAQKIDTLLRLLVTAPTVGLKELYEAHLRLAKVPETAPRDLRSNDPWWRRLFDEKARVVMLADLRSWWNRLLRRRNAEPSSDLAKTYLYPVLDSLTKELVVLSGAANFQVQTAKDKIVLGFDDATRFTDKGGVAATEYFESYFDDQRRGVVGATPLTLFVTPWSFFNGRNSAVEGPVGISISNRSVLTETALAESYVSSEPRFHTLGYAPEGFRTILASSSRAVRRWQFIPWFRWLMGGHIGFLRLAGIVVMFGGVAALSAWFSLRAMQPTLFHVSIDKGTISCDDGDLAVAANVPCSGTVDAKFAVNGIFPGSCYLNVARFVLPGTNPDASFQSVGTPWSPPPMDSDDQNCQLNHAFNLKAALSGGADELTNDIRVVGEASANGDATFASRSIYFDVKDKTNEDTAAANNNVRLIDFAWVSARPDSEGIALGKVIEFAIADHQFSNPVGSVRASHLCIDIGVRLNILEIGTEKPADQLTSIASDPPGKDIQIVRLAFGSEEDIPPVAQTLLDKPLFSPVVPQVAEQQPGTEAADRASKLQHYPALNPILARPSPIGLGRDRLVGTCT